MTSSKYITRNDLDEVTNQMSDTDVATISPLFQELIVIGETRNEAKSIIRTLTKRFQIVSPTITEKVHALTDLHTLDTLADFAYDCQSLAEFEAALR